jgi:predicted lactoylglutathione lyase
MIGYVTLGVRDLKRGAAMYDAIAREMGVGRMMEGERFIAWGEPGGAAGLGIALPFDGRPQSWGNGVMVALQAKDAGHVKRIYDIAIQHGSTDEGAPGDRGGGFYAAYFRDPDGNKLNAFCMAG